MWFPGKIYRVKLYNLKVKKGITTELVFRSETAAKTWVKEWCAQGESFFADYVEEREEGAAVECIEG